MSYSRREFLETAALTSLAAQPAAAAKKDSRTGMPLRKLGKTGVQVSILAFGSGSRWLGYKDEDKALAAMDKAIDLGISYIDTAYNYGNGQSETWVGKLMPKRRKQIFLATKVGERNGDAAMKIIEGSLKRLQTDQVDLLHIHSLTDMEDVAKIEAPDGVLKVLRKLRDEKVARFIGVTSHTDPIALKTLLERNDFDVTQMALNAARAGNAKGYGMVGESYPHSFEKDALPVANAKKMGVIAMKVFAQEKLNGKAPVEKLISYSLSLPVTAAVVGMPEVAHIEQNIQVAKAFKPLAPAEMKELSGGLAASHKAEIDRFFSDHVDC
jgi:aryl-alcohol dehydrogenase-like predicted oxidoreductase